MLLYDEIPSDVDSNIDTDDDNNEDDFQLETSNTDNVPIFDITLPDAIIDDDGQPSSPTVESTSPATVQPLADNIAASTSSGTDVLLPPSPATIQPSTPAVRSRIPPQWSTNFSPSISDSVFNQETGPTESITNLASPSPYDLFKTFIDDEIIDSLVFPTNLYAQQSGKRYIPTDRKEMETFLGINIMMGIKRLPRYRDYWSSEIDLNDAFISKLMPLNRFSWLLGNLHLNDNSLQPRRSDPTFDKLYKLRPFLNSISKNFRSSFKPNPDMAVDESMIKFKGRSCLKQYMPKKPIKRGYKVWVLCDKSGYALKFEIYTGKIGQTVQKNLGENVVKRLVEEYQGYNYTVYFDNYFTSYNLMEDLKSANINACGTVNKKRINLPHFKDDKKMTRGEHEWYASGTIIAMKWKDNNAVHLLSNFYNPMEVEQVMRRSRTGERVGFSCPAAIADIFRIIN
ncbi:piggyBac transposable element-derived protein 3-like [Onthophagus taurus]|uniref:piggyBac transposable element-derived protein 3-like n=1 Tax=Onthophagus taurus TaxID=166361 RepID=UPI0039BDBA31